MQSFLTGGSGPSFKAVRQLQTEVAGKADEDVPVDHGVLKQSQVKTPVIVTGQSVSGGVEYRTEYAMYVHDGTQPHVIRPGKKSVLRWVPKGGGAPVFSSSARHPGTKAQPWLRDALRDRASKFGFVFTER